MTSLLTFTFYTFCNTKTKKTVKQPNKKIIIKPKMSQKSGEKKTILPKQKSLTKPKVIPPEKEIIKINKQNTTKVKAKNQKELSDSRTATLLTEVREFINENTFSTISLTSALLTELKKNQKTLNEYQQKDIIFDLLTAFTNTLDKMIASTVFTNTTQYDLAKDFLNVIEKPTKTNNKLYNEILTIDNITNLKNNSISPREYLKGYYNANLNLKK
jgi:hypothetical protein